MKGRGLKRVVGVVALLGGIALAAVFYVVFMVKKSWDSRDSELFASRSGAVTSPPNSVVMSPRDLHGGGVAPIDRAQVASEQTGEAAMLKSGIAGIVIARTAEGGVAPNVTGRLVGQAVTDRGVQPFDVAVSKGKWALSGKNYRPKGIDNLSEVWIEGQSAQLLRVSRPDASSVVSPFTIEVLLTQAITLQVRDDNNVILNLVRLSDTPRVGPYFDGSSGRRLVGEGLNSPVAITRSLLEREGVGAWIGVGAEGYAWKDVAIDPSFSGSRVVVLPRAGTLVCDVTGIPETKCIDFHVGTMDGQSVIGSRRVCSDGVVVFEDAPTGWLRVYGNAVDERETTLAVEEAYIDIQPQVPNHTRVRVVSVVDSTTTVSGSLFVPGAWGWSYTSLHATCLDVAPGTFGRTRRLELTETEHSMGGASFRWEGEHMLPGNYEFTLNASIYSWFLSVPEYGLSNVVFQTPPPTILPVKVVDAGTNRVLDDCDVDWFTHSEHESDGGVPNAASKNGDQNVYLLRVPQAKVELGVSKLGYHPYYEIVDAASITDVLTIGLQPAQWFSFACVDGNLKLEIPMAWNPEVSVSNDDGGLVVFEERTKFVRRIQVSQPGVYKVQPPEIAGYLAAEPVYVDVGEGAPLSVSVQLRRDSP